MIIQLIIDPAAKAQRMKQNYYLTILIHPAIGRQERFKIYI